MAASRMPSRKKSLKAEKPRMLMVSPRAAPSPAFSVTPGTFFSASVRRVTALVLDQLLRLRRSPTAAYPAA